MWSSDGRRIAFATRDCAPVTAGFCPTEVWIMNADGTGRENLTRRWGRELLPIWSPDWRRVAYVVNPCSGVRGTCAGTTEIYRMNANGTGVRKLARGVRYRQSSGQCGERVRRDSDVVAGRPEDRLRQRPNRFSRGLRHERRRERAAAADSAREA